MTPLEIKKIDLEMKVIDKNTSSSPQRTKLANRALRN